MASTARGRALGVALKTARKARNLTLRELGAKINRPAATLSTWETATHRPKPDQVAQVLSALGVNGDEYDEIITLAYDEDASPWVATSIPSQRAQLNALINFESSATMLTDVAMALIPGILQTSDYARAMMVAAGVPKSEIATRATLRAGRKDALTRHEPVQYEAYLSPAAYTHVIGGTRVMVDQLKLVLELAARPNVSIRAVRRDAGWHPGLEGAFKLMNFADDPALVHVETRQSGLFFHDEPDVSEYRRAVTFIRNVSHSEAETQELISQTVREMKG